MSSHPPGAVLVGSHVLEEEISFFCKTNMDEIYTQFLTYGLSRNEQVLSTRNKTSMFMIDSPRGFTKIFSVRVIGLRVKRNKKPSLTILGLQNEKHESQNAQFRGPRRACGLL